MQYAVIIPTLNPGKALPALLEALRRQTVKPEEILIADSSSDDGTAEWIRQEPGVRVISVKREEFDHGGTRDMALRTCAAPFAVAIRSHCTTERSAPHRRFFFSVCRPVLSFDPFVSGCAARCKSA